MPSGDFSRQLAEAERMMRELRNRNFGKHLREAEAEKREAQLCKAFPNSCIQSILIGLKYNVQSTISSPVTGIIEGIVISVYITVTALYGENG